LIGLLTVVRLFFVVGSAVGMTFFNVYMDAGLHVPTVQIGIAVAVSRLAAVPAALITPLLAARWGNATLALWASVGVALFLTPLALASVWQTAALAYVGVIAMTSIRYPAFLVYSMSTIPARYRSVVAGAGEMAAGLSFAFIALAGGYIIVTQGYRTLFFTGAALNLLGTLVFGLFIATRRDP
jgi:predicted MFS family arabinose efflux permease